MKPLPPTSPTPGGRNASVHGASQDRPRGGARGPAWRPKTRRSATPERQGATGSDARPLRLVGAAEANDHAVTPKPQPQPPTPIAGPTDPRWVLAVRTAEALQGDVLPPDQRQRLMRLAKAMGLTPFDGCLIIAMIQDQARRGLLARHCPAAAGPQLSMVPLPRPRGLLDGLRQTPGKVLSIAAAVLALQALVVWVLLS